MWERKGKTKRKRKRMKEGKTKGNRKGKGRGEEGRDCRNTHCLWEDGKMDEQDTACK